MRSIGRTSLATSGAQLPQCCCLIRDARLVSAAFKLPSEEPLSLRLQIRTIACGYHPGTEKRDPCFTEQRREPNHGVERRLWSGSFQFTGSTPLDVPNCGPTQINSFLPGLCLSMVAMWPRHISDKRVGLYFMAAFIFCRRRGTTVRCSRISWRFETRQEVEGVLGWAKSEASALPSVEGPTLPIIPKESMAKTETGLARCPPSLCRYLMIFHSLRLMPASGR